MPGQNDAPSAAADYWAVEQCYATVLLAHEERGEPLPAPNGQPSKVVDDNGAGRGLISRATPWPIPSSWRN